MMERKALILFFLLILVLFAVGLTLQSFHAAAQDIYPTPEPHCPVYHPNCALYLGDFDDPTFTPSPTIAPIDWSGEPMVTLGQYRAFSTENTLVFVDTESGAVVLWLEISYPLAPGEEHYLLADNGVVSVWLLTTGEWQVEAKETGVTKVMIFAGLPIADPQYSEKEVGE
jgi:hypothetical protein